MTFNALMLATLVVIAVAFVWLMSSLPRIEGQIMVRGLELPATVARDEHGIPRISARSSRDAYFVLGWVHAQDRIWQMDLQRHVAAGRLAELVGERGVANDRFMRTMGLQRLAEDSFAGLDKSTRDMLTAYSDGINSWLDAHWHRLPLEYRVLGLRAEKWAPADSLTWGRLMGLQLAGNWHDEILRGKLSTRFDAKRLAELFPLPAADSPITLAQGDDGRTSIPTKPGLALSPDGVDSLLAALPPAAEPRLESNAWVIDGRRTASGKPLLANDPHLSLQAPIQWYLATIEAPGLSVSGATVPGTPFHLIGHNPRIAWGMTATQADIVDLFIEKVSADGTSYLTPNGPQPFTLHQEIIKVKGGDDVVLPVRETRNGPVISDLIAKDLAGPNEVVALRSSALAPNDLTAQAFNRLQRAVDWRSFQAAVKDFGAPVQNLFYADSAGNIGFTVAGRVPVRKSGDGSVPVAGWTGEGEWTGWIPPAKLPQAYNPKAGAIVNANNRVVAQTSLGTYWPEGYRAQRIATLLGTRTGLAAEDMAAMQVDAVSLVALNFKDLATRIEVKDERTRQAAQMIAAWDGNALKDRPEPLIFNAWMRQMWHDVLTPSLGEDLRAFGPLRPAVLQGIFTRYRHWCTDAANPTQSCEDVAARSLETVIADLSARHGPDPRTWSWGSEHRAVFANPIMTPVLKAVPFLDRLVNQSAATDGDDFTVNRGTYAADSFTQVHGAGLRAIFDLADLRASRFVIATGQSGNILSHHYDDMLPEWLANKGIPIGRSPDDNAVLTLEPMY
jgi:penicillin G amidase